MLRLRVLGFHPVSEAVSLRRGLRMCIFELLCGRSSDHTVGNPGLEEERDGSHRRSGSSLRTCAYIEETSRKMVRFWMTTSLLTAHKHWGGDKKDRVYQG